MSTLAESAEAETPVPGMPAPAPGAAVPSGQYAGLATRVIAFALDAALINLVAIIVEVGAAVIVSLLHLPKDLHTVLAAVGGAAYVLWSIAYFVTFWSTTGQTPGGRVMQIRVVTRTGGTPKPRRALIRCVGILLAALPLFAGYIRILFDSRRRGFQDRLAGTLVVRAPQASMAEARRAKQRAAYEVSRRPPASSLGRAGTSSVSGDDGHAPVLNA